MQIMFMNINKVDGKLDHLIIPKETKFSLIR